MWLLGRDVVNYETACISRITNLVSRESYKFIQQIRTPVLLLSLERDFK